MAYIDGVHCYNFRIYVKHIRRYCSTFDINSFRKHINGRAYLLYDARNNPFKRTNDVSGFVVNNIKRYKI